MYLANNIALQNSGVYGSSSSAARVGDAASDVSRENSLIKEMMVATKEIPGMPTIDDMESGESNNKRSSPRYDYGPVMHRWGNAFPKGDPLSEDLSFLPSSRIAFCGDYVASSERVRFGSFESALLSGTFAGEKIARYCQEQQLLSSTQ